MSPINRIYRLTSLALAGLMFVTSMSYSVDLHYCQGALMGFSLLGTTKSCHEVKNSCSRHSEEAMTAEEESNCCSNSHINIDNLDEDFTTPQLVEFSNDDIGFLVAYCQIFVQETLSNKDVVKYRRYKPPLPDEDILILNQRFLL